jgi:hypothetical protein
VDKEKAADIDAAHALDARLSRDEWLEREAQVLYRVSQASKERITLAELSQECNLTIGQTYRAVASLQDLYYVTVREMTAPTDWWQLDVAITREGHAWLRTTHGKRGLLMEKQWHFHAPVTAQSIGDNAYMPDARMKSIPVDSSAVQGFIAAARELRARVEDETTAGHLDAELHALETAQDKRDPVNRLLGMARGLGEIGLPLVAAAEKLQGMFGG